jgi:NADH-quinone oxidoreductase subunit G
LKGGQLTVTPWATILPELRQRFADAAKANAKSVAAILSPFLTCEEAFLLAQYVKGLSKDARLYLGPVPILGEDDTYPKDRRGRPVEPVKFTIRAEKCPNRRGVEAVLKHFEGELRPFDRAVEAASRGELTAIWVAAGYPRGGGYVGPAQWLSDDQAAAVRKSALLVVQDVLPSSVSAKADFVLPAAAWAEKEGTFVNHAGLAQAITKAAHAPGESRSEGQVFADLLGRRGLLHAGPVRGELAAAVPALSGLGADMSGQGTRLELAVVK